MSRITTHVLDTTQGRPARAVPVVLKQRVGRKWKDIAGGATDADGRIMNLIPESTLIEEGVYELTFDTEDYFREQGMVSFYPAVSIMFRVRDSKQHHHVPVLLSPHGYTTYRGS